MFDVAAREPIGPPVYADGRDYTAAISGLAACELSGCPMLVSVNRKGTIVGWDPATGAPHGERLHMGSGLACELALGVWRGMTIAVTGDGAGRIRVRTF